MSITVLQKNGLEYFWSKLKTYLSTNYVKKVDMGELATPEQLSISTVSPLPTGVSSISILQVIQCGRVVTVQIEFTLSAALSNWTAVVSSGLPAPFGSTTVITTAGNWGTTVLRGCRVSVGTTGNLQLRYGAAGTYRAQFTYIAKDS